MDVVEACVEGVGDGPLRHQPDNAPGAMASDGDIKHQKIYGRSI
jgi:hypothetical protein